MFFFLLQRSMLLNLFDDFNLFLLNVLAAPCGKHPSVYRCSPLFLFTLFIAALVAHFQQLSTALERTMCTVSPPPPLLSLSVSEFDRNQKSHYAAKAPFQEKI